MSEGLLRETARLSKATRFFQVSGRSWDLEALCPLSRSASVRI